MLRLINTSWEKVEHTFRREDGTRIRHLSPDQREGLAMSSKKILNAENEDQNQRKA